MLKSNRYFIDYVRQMKLASLDTDDLFEEAALFSAIDPRNLRASDVKHIETQMDTEIAAYRERFGLAETLNYVIRAGRERLYPILLKRICREFSQNEGRFPTAKEVFQTIKEYVERAGSDKQNDRLENTEI